MFNQRTALPSLLVSLILIGACHQSDSTGQGDLTEQDVSTEQDTRDDLFFARTLESLEHLFLFQGDGNNAERWQTADGLRNPKPPSDIGAIGQLVAADFNGDGKDDLFFLKSDGKQLFLFQGDGNNAERWQQADGLRNPKPPSDLLSPQYFIRRLYSRVVAGHFNDDPKVDLFFLMRNGEQLFLFQGDGNNAERWQQADGLRNPKPPSDNISQYFNTYVVAGDFNGNGKDDLFFHSRRSCEHFFLFQGDGDNAERWQDPEMLRNPKSPSDVCGRSVSGDFNNNGKDDLFFINENGEHLFLFQGDGDNAERWQNADGLRNPKSSSDLQGFSYYVVAGDFNGNGKDDLFFVQGDIERTNGEHLFLFQGDGNNAERWQQADGLRNTKPASDLSDFHFVVAGQFNGIRIR